MRLAHTLSRLLTGSLAGEVHEAREALQEAYVACVQRACQLRRHADLAPQEAGAEGLSDLAAAEEAQANRLREAIATAGLVVPEVPSPSWTGAGLSHWARLVQDLEAHRAAEARLQELARRFADATPELAGLFDGLAREERAHCESLRALAARADPQAID
jgi:hypothetical protein